MTHQLGLSKYHIRKDEDSQPTTLVWGEYTGIPKITPRDKMFSYKNKITSHTCAEKEIVITCASDVICQIKVEKKMLEHQMFTYTTVITVSAVSPVAFLQVRNSQLDTWDGDESAERQFASLPSCCLERSCHSLLQNQTKRASCVFCSSSFSSKD